MNRLGVLRGSLAGQTVWVLGNGPSLQGVPKERVPVERAVGVNRILRTHNVGYVVIVDPDVWAAEGKSVLAGGARLVVGENLYWPLVRGHFPEERLVVFDWRASVVPGAGGDIIHKGCITGYYAAEIAAQMVAPGGRVILLGMDLAYPSSGNTHSYGDGRGEGASDAPFFRGIRAFRRLREALTGRVEFSVVGPSALLSEGFPSIGLDMA